MSLELKDYFWAPGHTFERLQASALIAVLALNKGDAAKTAKDLGINRSSVYRLCQSLLTAKERNELMRRRTHNITRTDKK